MMTMALEPGDAATWAGSAIALLLAVVTAIQQRRQSKEQEQADRVAKRQTEAAERRALAVEEGLQRLIAGLPEALQGSAQAQLAAEPSRQAAAVRWELTRPGGNIFVLRNTGSETATEVNVDVGDHPAGLTRRVPEGGVVRAQESTDFVIIPAWGHPTPRELKVTWEGGAEQAVLPVPSVG